MFADLASDDRKRAQFVAYSGVMQRPLAIVSESLTLVTEGERVALFGQDVTVPSGSTFLMCNGAHVRPGAVNAHTHLYGGLAPLGLPPAEPPPSNFLQILERVWWRLDRVLDAETLRAAARFYVARALLAGTTTLVDHHESPPLIEGSLDVLADACGELGMRAVLSYGATERNGGADEATRGLAECARFIRENKRPGLRGLVGIHASFTVSDETLSKAGALARELGVGLHVHVAEDRADVDDARQRGYAGPLERLLATEALPPGSVLAHGVHLGADQVRRAQSEGMWIVQNPRSNKNNRVGYPAALRHSSRVALGTDGFPAAMRDEEDMLFEVGLAEGEDGAVLARRAVAAHGLCQELFGAPFAPLAAGSMADLAVIEDGTKRVRHVIVGGELVVRDGALARSDLARIEAEAHGAAARLWERMRSLP